jgi:hypothetical protein
VASLRYCCENTGATERIRFGAARAELPELAAVDLVFLGPKIILPEFALGDVGPMALGVLTLSKTESIGSWASPACRCCCTRSSSRALGTAEREIACWFRLWQSHSSIVNSATHVQRRPLTLTSVLTP